MLGSLISFASNVASNVSPFGKQARCEGQIANVAFHALPSCVNKALGVEGFKYIGGNVKTFNCESDLQKAVTLHGMDEAVRNMKSSEKERLSRIDIDIISESDSGIEMQDLSKPVLKAGKTENAIQREKREFNEKFNKIMQAELDKESSKREKLKLKAKEASDKIEAAIKKHAEEKSKKKIAEAKEILRLNGETISSREIRNMKDIAAKIKRTRSAAENEGTSFDMCDKKAICKFNSKVIIEESIHESDAVKIAKGKVEEVRADKMKKDIYARDEQRRLENKPSFFSKAARFIKVF